MNASFETTAEFKTDAFGGKDGITFIYFMEPAAEVSESGPYTFGPAKPEALGGEGFRNEVPRDTFAGEEDNLAFGT